MTPTQSADVSQRKLLTLLSAQSAINGAAATLLRRDAPAYRRMITKADLQSRQRRTSGASRVAP